MADPPKQKPFTPFADVAKKILDIMEDPSKSRDKKPGMTEEDISPPASPPTLPSKNRNKF